MFKNVLVFFVPLCVQVLCARIEDEPRFRAMIDSWIQDGSVPEFPAYSGAFQIACAQQLQGNLSQFVTSSLYR